MSPFSFITTCGFIVALLKEKPKYLEKFDNDYTDPHPEMETQYLGLKRHDRFWFPHAFKYVAWCIVVVIITVSSVILIYYGMSFGMIKTYLWMTGIVSSFIIGFLITTPVRIFLLSLLDSLLIKIKPVVVKRKVLADFLTNPEDPEKLKRVEDKRKYNEHLYRPVPVHKLQNRLEDMKYNIELRNLTVDVISYIFFMITVYYVVLINKSDMGYYSTEVIQNLVVRASYTNSIPFTEVTTYDTFLEYLNKTLFPALMLNYRDYTKVWGFKDLNVKLFKAHQNKKKKRSHDTIRDSNFTRRKKQVFLGSEELGDKDKDGNTSNVFQRGWTMDPAIKIIGKPRLRQIRVTTDSCKQLVVLEGRNLKCAAELTLFNQDTKNYSLEWGPPPPKGLTPMNVIPWSYQTGWQTMTLPTYAKFSSYPSGGYVLELARNIEDSRIILKFMDEFQWVDVRTRVVFIEFTTYCVNTNLFNVVTLIAEKSATGYFIPSYEIETCKFTFMMVEVEIISIVMAILFSILLFFFLLREGLRIHRTSFKQYLKRAFAVLDLLVIFLGFLSLIFIILRSIYVTHLLNKLERSNNNSYVSFAVAAYWHKWSVFIEALLVCLASFKIFRLLAFKVVFFQILTTLTHCYKHFIDLVILIIILVVTFSLFFHLTLLMYAYEFSSVGLSISTMIGRSAGLDDTFNFSVFKASSWYLAPLFFALFVVITTMIFINLFIAVICLYFHEIRKVSLVKKYTLIKYIKHILTSDRHSDLLPVSDKSAFQKESFPRLRGGGVKHSKPKKKIKAKKTRQKINKEHEDKISLQDFVVEKRYNTLDYQKLLLNRETAMKFLIQAALLEDGNQKKIARQQALRALFVSFVCGRKNDQETQEKYLIAVKKSEEMIINENRMSEMKKIVQEFGRKKNWIKEESIEGFEEISQIDNIIQDLEKKLTLILNKVKVLSLSKK